MQDLCGSGSVFRIRIQTGKYRIIRGKGCKIEHVNSQFRDLNISFTIDIITLDPAPNWAKKGSWSKHCLICYDFILCKIAWILDNIPVLPRSRSFAFFFLLLGLLFVFLFLLAAYSFLQFVLAQRLERCVRVCVARCWTRE